MAAKPVLLERGEHLAEIRDLFLITPANTDYVLGKKPRRLQSTTLLAPVFMVLLVVLIGTLPVLLVLGSGQNQTIIWVLVLVIALVGGYFIVRTYRNYRRDSRLDGQGKLLRATITDVTTRERSEGVQALMSILQVGLVILEFLSMFSGGNTSSGGAGANNDFYEVRIACKFTTPDGREIHSVAARNRPDLRQKPLPQVGDSLLVLYAGDATIMVL